jgi:hypothetical protein
MLKELQSEILALQWL